MIYYLNGVGYSDNYSEFFKAFNRASHQPGDRMIMKTLGDYLKQEGLQQGMQMGIYPEKQDNAKKMLCMGMKEAMLREVPGLSKKEVNHLKGGSV